MPIEGVVVRAVCNQNVVPHGSRTAGVVDAELIVAIVGDRVVFHGGGIEGGVEVESVAAVAVDEVVCEREVCAVDEIDARRRVGSHLHPADCQMIGIHGINAAVAAGELHPALRRRGMDAALGRGDRHVVGVIQIPGVAGRSRVGAIEYHPIRRSLKCHGGRAVALVETIDCDVGSKSVRPRVDSYHVARSRSYSSITACTVALGAPGLSPSLTSSPTAVHHASLLVELSFT